MQQKKVPMRMCLGCGEMYPKRELIRAVKNKEGEISLDLIGKAPGRGANGHIAIGTYNVDRAVYHLGLQGVRFDQASRKTDAKGNTKAIYLQDEVGGFAIHLVKR